MDTNLQEIRLAKNIGIISKTVIGVVMSVVRTAGGQVGVPTWPRWKEVAEPIL